MQELSRRTFCQNTLGSLLTYSLLETLFAGDAFADEEEGLFSGYFLALKGDSPLFRRC